ncbi:MAG: hypothetical protein GTO45_40995 [Candidatus Aminicenantes bacterium]|nr:hypothetical protein [Candidatus Aminicenantes bacterium]NIM84982.1 hypothetical protein [Candidatus Aminicenantes bacterium]NIN24496.1 hypothetical protein [Candidatus Aminicenantes bacterium]NIN48260.1 hypothetical protein [Candidatus Aminicenantes bacterium]NIN91163.1 hypothetical protein [Candidatus Aminicenantes bacterium]
MIHEEEHSLFCDTCGAQIEPGSQYCSLCGMKVASKKKKEAFTGEDESHSTRLYHVYSVVNNFPYRSVYYDNLKISWFMVGREEPQVPFEEVIVNYAKLSLSAKVNPENFIKELFTLEEAELLKRYLDSLRKFNATIEVCQLPVNEHARGYRDFPPAPGIDFFILSDKENYNLPFRVEGVFNTNMADRRVVADDRTTVVTGISVKDIDKYLD